MFLFNSKTDFGTAGTHQHSSHLRWSASIADDCRQLQKCCDLVSAFGWRAEHRPEWVHEIAILIQTQAFRTNVENVKSGAINQTALVASSAICGLSLQYLCSVWACDWVYLSQWSIMITNTHLWLSNLTKNKKIDWT